MNSILYGCLACLAATPFVLARGAEGGTVPLDVEFKLTDREYRPLAGVPLRLVLGIEDWQAADAGVRIVTGEDGAARFTTQAVIDRRWQWINVGFTPFSIPKRVDHISIALALEACSHANAEGPVAVIVPIKPDELVVKSTTTGDTSTFVRRSKVKTLVERTKAICKRLGRGTTEEPDHLQYYLLRAPDNRPRRRTAQQRDELAPFQLSEFHRAPVSQDRTYSFPDRRGLVSEYESHSATNQLLAKVAYVRMSRNENPAPTT